MKTASNNRFQGTLHKVSGPLNRDVGNNDMKIWNNVLSAMTVCSWTAFLFLDHKLQQVTAQAVQDQSGTYGELFGPLSFFRPAVLVLSLLLTATALCLLVFGYSHSIPKQE